MAYWLGVLPSVVSGLLLGAHFTRYGALVPAAICLAGPAAAAVSRRDWAINASRLLMWTGVLLWLAGAWQMAQVRRVSGQPWLRLVFILSAVAAWTAFSGWLLGRKRVREGLRYAAA